MSTEYNYPEDEFDEAARTRENVGIHRIPTPLWRRLLTPLVVIVVAVALGWGVVKHFGAEQITPSDPGMHAGQLGDSPTDLPTELVPGTEPGGTSATSAPSAPAGQPSDSPTASPQPAPEPAPALEKGVPVSVLNGGRVRGLAGRMQGLLEGRGYTNVEAGNYRAASPSDTTVYYPDEALAATAQDIASALGITNVKMNAEILSGRKVLIVLRADFTEPTN